jgi:uncharacterized membrane protein
MHHSARLRLAHRAVLAAWLLLAAGVSSAALRSAAWPRSGWLVLGLLVPLLLPLRGLLRNDRRSQAWATLCVTPYLIYGMTELVANPRLRVLAAAILVASLALFAALVASLRLGRGGNAAQP